MLAFKVWEKELNKQATGEESESEGGGAAAHQRGPVDVGVERLDGPGLLDGF